MTTAARPPLSRSLGFWLLLGALALAGPAGCRGPDDMVHRQHRAQRQVAVLATGAEGRAAARPQTEHLVFTSFRDDGEFGYYLATSRDGYIWRNVSERAIFVPRTPNASGMRDPNVAQGPDGVFHMVWTMVGPYPRSIGYARSTDLIDWTDVRAVQVVPDSWPVDWTWAPELYYDDSRGEWIVAWSVAVKGRNEHTLAQAEHNHRLYYNTTRDFREFSPAQPFYDPGFPVIDPAFLDVGRDLILFFKDERQWGPAGEKKQIRWARGSSPRGPWGEPSAAITMRWCEGPSPIMLGDDIVVYFDEYTRGAYGAVRSRDMVTWDDVSTQMRFPPGHRHGSVIRVDPELFEKIERLRETGGASAQASGGAH